VAAALDELNADPHVNSIALTDPGTPTLTLTSLQADATALGKITSPYTLAISNAGANVAATAAIISANLNGFETSLPSSITVTDNKALGVTVGQITSDAAALALASNANGSAYTLAVSDSAANVTADLDGLNANSHVTSIALTDLGTPALTLTAAQAANDATALGEISTPYTIKISDTAANVVANLAALNANSHVTSIALTDPGTPALTLTLAEALNDNKALGEITTSHTVALADTPGNIALITSAQASTLKTNGYASIASTTGAVSMTVAEAQLLSGDGITVTGGPLTATSAAASMLALTTAQAASLVSAGYILAVLDTAPHIQALTAAQVAGLGALHVTQISASDASVALSVALATRLEAAKIAVTAPVGLTVTLTDLSPNLGAMPVSLIAGLAGLGVSSIVSANGSVSINVQQAIALESASLRITAPSGGVVAVTVKDLAVNLMALTTGQITSLPGTGVSALAATDLGVTLSVAQAQAFEAVKLKISVPAGAKVALLDTAANVEALNAAQITALPGIGVTGVNVSDANNVTLTVAQAAAFETSKIALSLQSGEPVIVADTAANIAKLTATQIAGFGALHVTQIQASDMSVKLTVSQANALESANIPVVAAPLLSLVQISDTAANLQSLNAAAINGLPGIGVSGLVASNTAVKFTVAQTMALEGSHLVVTPFPGTTVTVSDTGSNIATLNVAQIGLLAATGFSGVTSTSGGVALSVAQAEALEGAGLKIIPPGGSEVTISDLAANIAAMSPSQLMALAATGVSGVTATDASVTLSLAQALALESPVIKVSVPTGSAVAVSDTASAIQALAATQIAGLKSIGVTALSASDTNVVLTVAQAVALESAGVAVSPPSGGSDAIVDTAAHIQALTAARSPASAPYM
jgi:hypothetical protein